MALQKEGDAESEVDLDDSNQEAEVYNLNVFGNNFNIRDAMQN